MEVTDFLSNHPLCCPARAQIFTGQYAHNNGVRSNSGPYGGYHALKDKGNHVGTWLKASGYRTAFIGKHLNYWSNSAHHQPGWTIFNPFYKGGYLPYGITMFNNGHPKRYGSTYTADLVGRLTRDYIDRFSRPGGAVLHLGLPAAAAQDAGERALGQPGPREAAPHHLLHGGAAGDVQPVVQGGRRQRQAELRPGQAGCLGEEGDRLPPGPDPVAACGRRPGRAIVRTLRDRNELANTYLFFVSDNGYLLGEHRLQGKNFPYEESLQVPLLVRGPGSPRRPARPDVRIVDLAPTFLDIAGRRRAAPSTGARCWTPSTATLRLRPLPDPGEHGRAPWWWRGVRTPTHTYVRYSNGFTELYDRVRTLPSAQRRRRPRVHRARAGHADQLAALRSQAGAACHTAPGGAP